MKKIILSMALCAYAFGASDMNTTEESISSGLKDKKNILSFNVGLWNMNWNQTSTSASMLKDPSDALDMNYNIDSSIAYVLALKFDYAHFNGSIEYSSDTTGSTNGEDDESIQNLNVGLSMLDYIPNLNAEVRYTKSNFKGQMNSKDASSGEYASSSFETKVDIFDIIIYPFNKYVGVGYRKYKYEFPQDAYITNSSGDLLKTEKGDAKGVLDLAYEGYFYTLVLDNKKMVDVKPEYNGFVYSLIIGMGKLTPSAGENEIIDSDGAAYFDTYLGDSDATFYDVLVGYSYKSKMNNNFAYGLTAGYRYNKIETEASESVDNNGYSMRTKFNTEFYGPFVNIVASF